MIIENREELLDAISYIHQIIANCERLQLKFSSGTSQYTLLENRIHALRIAVYFMIQAFDVSNSTQVSVITMSELEQALPPLVSIIHKCEKAQSKYQEGTKQYKRYIKMITIFKMAHGFVDETYQKAESNVR